MPRLTAVRDQIHQVVLNLSINAIQASVEGGTITIKVDSDGPVAAPTGVRIGFRDMGEGISEENLERTFDPFSRPRIPTTEPDWA